jgi:hypothetical protein
MIRLGISRPLRRPGVLIYGRWFVVGGRRVNPLKEALTVLADVLAKRPAEEILFDWFRSGRLVGELSSAGIPRCKPRLIASTKSIWRSSAKGSVTRHCKTIDWRAHTVQHSVMK